jgi:hypothetical protein
MGKKCDDLVFCHGRTSQAQSVYAWKKLSSYFFYRMFTSYKSLSSSQSWWTYHCIIDESLTLYKSLSSSQSWWTYHCVIYESLTLYKSLSSSQSWWTYGCENNQFYPDNLPSHHNEGPGQNLLYSGESKYSLS